MGDSFNVDDQPFILPRERELGLNFKNRFMISRRLVNTSLIIGILVAGMMVPALTINQAHAAAFTNISASPANSIGFKGTQYAIFAQIATAGTVAKVVVQFPTGTTLVSGSQVPIFLLGGAAQPGITTVDTTNAKVTYTLNTPTSTSIGEQIFLFIQKVRNPQTAGDVTLQLSLETLDTNGNPIDGPTNINFGIQKNATPQSPTGASGSPGLVDIGQISTFAILGNTAVNLNSIATTVEGDMGVSPGSSITGDTLITQNFGTEHKDDAVATAAESDANTVYTGLNGLTCPAANTFSGTKDLGGSTLAPGVYCTSGSFQITGTLTLSGSGLYVLQSPGTLTTASISSIVLQNGAHPTNIFWTVGSTTTLGQSSTIDGTILSQGSITGSGNNTVTGRLVSLTGGVTLSGGTVSLPSDVGDINEGSMSGSSGSTGLTVNGNINLSGNIVSSNDICIGSC